MSEYWKSTPKYWCKFCEIYVRDTGIERKNHEASAKHQNSIQRSLRNLHKNQAQEQRDQQRAKNEVARLNGVASGSSGRTVAAPPSAIPTYTRASASSSNVDYAAHQRAQAQQLAAMGMAIPRELQETATDPGKWQVVSRRLINEDEAAGNVEAAVAIKGVHKRKAEDDDDLEEATTSKRKVWGTSRKTYPGQTTAEDDSTDLDTLLSGVNKKPALPPELSQGQSTTATMDQGSPDNIKQETTTKHEPATLTNDTDDAKQEIGESSITAPPVVTFKKRKAKR